MGIPVINEFAEFGYANGPDLLVNDGANLAEIHGNIDKRTNNTIFNHYNTIHMHSRTGWGVAYAPGTFVVLFRAFFPNPCELTAAHMIGFGDDTATNSEFDDSGGDANNTVTAQIATYDAAGNPADNTVIVLAKGNIDYFGGSLPIRIGAGYTLRWGAQTHASAHVSFLPWLQATLLLKQEHV
jgi:hypothetical protein